MYQYVFLSSGVKYDVEIKRNNVADKYIKIAATIQNFFEEYMKDGAVSLICSKKNKIQYEITKIDSIEAGRESKS